MKTKKQLPFIFLFIITTNFITYSVDLEQEQLDRHNDKKLIALINANEKLYKTNKNNRIKLTNENFTTLQEHCKKTLTERDSKGEYLNKQLAIIISNFYRTAINNQKNLQNFIPSFPSTTKEYLDLLSLMNSDGKWYEKTLSYAQLCAKPFPYLTQIINQEVTTVKKFITDINADTTLALITYFENVLTDNTKSINELKNNIYFLNTIKAKTSAHTLKSEKLTTLQGIMQDLSALREMHTNNFNTTQQSITLINQSNFLNKESKQTINYLNNRLTTTRQEILSLLQKSENISNDIIITIQPKNVLPSCEICNKSENIKFCSNCKQAAYCSESCQRKAWKWHKNSCSKQSSLLVKT